MKIRSYARSCKFSNGPLHHVTDIRYREDAADLNKPEDLPDSMYNNFREQEFVSMKKQYQAVTAEEAVKVIKSGDHVHISSVSNVPQCLVKALCDRGRAGELKNVYIHHLHTALRLAAQKLPVTTKFASRNFWVIT